MALQPVTRLPGLGQWRRYCVHCEDRECQKQEEPCSAPCVSVVVWVVQPPLQRELLTAQVRPYIAGLVVQPEQAAPGLPEGVVIPVALEDEAAVGHTSGDCHSSNS